MSGILKIKTFPLIKTSSTLATESFSYLSVQLSAGLDQKTSCDILAIFFSSAYSFISSSSCFNDDIGSTSFGFLSLKNMQHAVLPALAFLKGQPIINPVISNVLPCLTALTDTVAGSTPYLIKSLTFLTNLDDISRLDVSVKS